jgi:predicted kinase
MITLTMFKGLPGSGKDTMAKKMMEDNPTMYKRVNKDDLRSMLDNGAWSGNNEKFVLIIRDEIIMNALMIAHKHVLCTDTNLDPKHEIRLREIAKSANVIFKTIDLTDVPVEECIKRDLKRFNSVGKDVIINMYKKYVKPLNKAPIVNYPTNPDLRDCVIVDLDGTLALFGDKNPYDRDFEKDIVNNPISILMDKMIHGISIIIVSGRSDKFRTITENWLFNNDIQYESLYMRKSGDTRKDCIIKEEIFNTYIRDKFNPVLVIDDRDQTVAYWRSIGLTCLQCADGDF